MSVFPEKIKIKIIDTRGCPLPNIAVMIRLFAARKNDYYCIPSISDSDGIIEVNKEWLRQEIKESKNLFIMDYSSELEDCAPKINIKVMDKVEVKNAVNARNLFKKVLNISEEEIIQLSNVDNSQYESITKMIEFNNELEIQVELHLKHT